MGFDGSRSVLSSFGKNNQSRCCHSIEIPLRPFIRRRYPNSKLRSQRLRALPSKAGHGASFLRYRRAFWGVAARRRRWSGGGHRGGPRRGDGAGVFNYKPAIGWAGASLLAFLLHCVMSTLYVLQPFMFQGLPTTVSSITGHCPNRSSAVYKLSVASSITSYFCRCSFMGVRRAPEGARSSWENCLALHIL